MRYSLLNFIVCQSCHGELTCVTLREARCEISATIFSFCGRVSPADALVGPVPVWRHASALAGRLERYATSAAPPDRNFIVALEEGLLVCAECGRWYPVTGFIPEILPDHLRNWDRDRTLLEKMSGSLPSDLLACLREFRPDVGPVVGQGEHYKLAEISLPRKIEDPSFWGPGYSAPFNPWNTEHTWHLIRNFALVEPLLDVRRGDAVLDLGCGYSWTTEWLLRSGYESVGFDICRAYLEIAVKRIGVDRPHLFVADVENLPIRNDSIHSTLGFEAFHHIPNRVRAMAELARALRPGGALVLAEPGPAHERSGTAAEVMEKFGTLEKGMELDDVRNYAAGSSLTLAQQHLILRFSETETKGCVPNNIMTLRKGASSGLS